MLLNLTGDNLGRIRTLRSPTWGLEVGKYRTEVEALVDGGRDYEFLSWTRQSLGVGLRNMGIG
jgi:hypothetical protein